MAELELRAEPEGKVDPTGQRVGLLAAALAVGLALVTIASHRAHTDAVLAQMQANDQWALFQARRLKYHTLELGSDLITQLVPASPGRERVIEEYTRNKQQYAREAKETSESAESNQKRVEVIEHKALRYDIGEGLLEIGLVLTSLYFISHKRLFPAIGLAAGLIGIAVALTGLL